MQQTLLKNKRIAADFRNTDIYRILIYFLICAFLGWKTIILGDAYFLDVDFIL